MSFRRDPEIKIPRVVYRDVRGWKYLVDEGITYQTGIYLYSGSVEYKGDTLARLTAGGSLIVYPGYAWDGPSGPTIDTPDWMDASLVHDIFYQLMREELVPQIDGENAREKLRRKSDKLMHKMLLEAGMPRFRAWYSYWGVRLFAAWAASPRFRGVRV